MDQEVLFELLEKKLGVKLPEALDEIPVHICSEMRTAIIHLLNDSETSSSSLYVFLVFLFEHLDRQVGQAPNLRLITQ